MDATALASAQKSCENLVNQVKNSRLNFILTETPYCVNISIKKRFLKEFPMTSADLQSSPNNSILLHENEDLKAQIKKLQAADESNKETIIILEARIKNAESEAHAHFKQNKKVSEALEKATEDASVLKNVINNLNQDAAKNNLEKNSLAKIIKTKDKEIYNLENRALNQQDNISNLKAKSNEMKDNTKKLEKEVKRLKQKIEKLDIKDTNENNRTNEKQTETDFIFQCEICEDKATKSTPKSSQSREPSSIINIPASSTCNPSESSSTQPTLTSLSTAIAEVPFEAVAELTENEIIMFGLDFKDIEAIKEGLKAGRDIEEVMKELCEHSDWPINL